MTPVGYQPWVGWLGRISQRKVCMSEDPTGLSNPAKTKLASELPHRFQFHPADSENRQIAHETVRRVCLEAAQQIVEVTGDASREQSLAVTHLEDAMFWANAAIARSDGPRT